MPVVETPGVFKGIPVGQAMRRQVVSLPSSAKVAQGIRMMIRYKVNAVLLTDNSIPYGVVSKTDLLGAYYAELPTETALGDVIGSQLLWRLVERDRRGAADIDPARAHECHHLRIQRRVRH